MLSHALTHGLQYAGYAFEVGVVVVFLFSGWWKKYAALFIYVSGFFFIDAVLRPATLYSYGFASPQYRDCYFATDLALTLGAFVLISTLVRRASREKKELWSFLRTVLVSVFMILVVISYLSLSAHYDHLALRFVIDFSKNIYFACLVLNTLLYIMLQYVDAVDDTLSLIVCGLGIEFAGPAASMALAYLFPNWVVGGNLVVRFTAQLCNLGMCLIWIYAATRKPAQIRIRVSPGLSNYRSIPALAHAPMRGTR